jgi:hypothetical protein
MSITTRQNNLFLTEDWKVIYQTFTNADFTSYDFENIRRVMINYIRENFPEDFNDYIESSEYLALIDLIAFLGQSLAFRIDLNARENFLELAERRESILRLAQLLSYNAKRNICASGLLKIDSISTTEEVLDATGKNLANIEVLWNDNTNSNWFDQFIKVINAAMLHNIEFGKPIANDTINGIYTEQYTLNSNLGTNVPVFPFSKTIDGSSYPFEAVSTVISNGNIKQDPPKQGNNVSLVYLDDLQGYGSANTGWFIHFRQGNTTQNVFTLSSPTTNQIVNINDTNINNDDVWLYSLDNTGTETTLWTQVPSVVGNNVIYNSLDKTIRNIYGVQTLANDSISLVFGDGIFANLPKGSFRCYYRTSSGKTYTINSKDMRNIIINIPYISTSGSQQTLRMVMSLNSTVTNASAAESNAEIKFNAPATYYTQNRMITGEDYNLAPLSVSQSIAKVKAINRVSSGISKNFDLIDASGNYSSTNSFCTDGIIYREEILEKFSFAFNTRTDISEILINQIQPLTQLNSTRDFYYQKYNSILFTDINPLFIVGTSGYNQSTGYIANNSDKTPFSVGVYTGSNLKYIEPGALVKFVPPAGKYFTTKGTLTSTPSVSTTDRIWTKVISVVGDGTASGAGLLSTGIGPITVGATIPSGAIIGQVIPKFLTYLSTDLQSSMVELIFNYQTFGLRFDINSRTWQIIQNRNLNFISPWSLGNAGDNTGQKLDSSWMIAFETDGVTYTVSYRGLEYFFESVAENRFYFDNTRKIYDSTTGSIQKNKVSVLKFNTLPYSTTSLGKDYDFKIINNVLGQDGYSSTKTVKITFIDSNDDEIADNPDSFNIVAIDPSNPNSNNNYIFFEKYVTDSYTEDYRYVSNENNKFLIFDSEQSIVSLSSYSDGQLFYFYTPNIVKVYDAASSILIITNNYYAAVGRSDIYFRYLHNADSTIRIDPSASNLIDIYILTKAYDIAYRNYLNGDISSEPLPPSNTYLMLTYGSALDNIKSISDDIIYHPARYKILFGSKADVRLQASFKVIKNTEQVITDNEVQTKVIQAINEFFSIGNFDFGDTFYFSELSAYVMSQLTPYITTFLIVPTSTDQVFGSLQQITSSPNEIFISGATTNDVQIIQSITSAQIGAQGNIITSSVQDILSSNLQSS